jgi:hypothetical protein
MLLQFIDGLVRGSGFLVLVLMLSAGSFQVDDFLRSHFGWFTYPRVNMFDLASTRAATFALAMLWSVWARGEAHGEHSVKTWSTLEIYGFIIYTFFVSCIVLASDSLETVVNILGGGLLIYMCYRLGERKKA